MVFLSSYFQVVWRRILYFYTLSFSHGVQVAFWCGYHSSAKNLLALCYKHPVFFSSVGVCFWVLWQQLQLSWRVIRVCNYLLAKWSRWYGGSCDIIDSYVFSLSCPCL